MIQDNVVVGMKYTLKDAQGNLLDSSGDSPMEYLQGHQNIIPGLEKELKGLIIGSRKQVVVGPEEAYGTHQPELKFSVQKSQFGDQAPEAGMVVQMNTPQGVFQAQVVELEGDNVVLDANHPLAGQTLHFDVEIVHIRDASAEELQHGHPHGPHGHHH